MTDDGEVPELSQQVSHGMNVHKSSSPTSAPVPSTSMNSLTSLAKLVLSSSVESALRNTNELDRRTNQSFRPTKPTNKKYSFQTTFRTPPPLPSYSISSKSTGRSLQSQQFPFMSPYEASARDTRFVPVSRSRHLDSNSAFHQHSSSSQSNSRNFNSYSPQPRNLNSPDHEQAWNVANNLNSPRSSNNFNNHYEQRWSPISRSFNPSYRALKWPNAEMFNNRIMSFSNDYSGYSSRMGSPSQKPLKSQEFRKEGQIRKKKSGSPKFPKKAVNEMANGFYYLSRGNKVAFNS